MNQLKNDVYCFIRSQISFVSRPAKIFMTLFLLSLPSWSFIEVKVDTSDIALSETQISKHGMNFQKFNPNQNLVSKSIGQPELPSQSFLVVGFPKDITVHLQTEIKATFENILIEPVTPESCRCVDLGTWKHSGYSFDRKNYFKSQPMVKKTLLGDFRGTPVTKVEVLLADYDAEKQSLKLFNNVEIKIDAEEFKFKAPQIRSYLVVAPAGWESAVADFVAYKANLGFSVRTEFISSPTNTKDLIRSLIAQDYSNYRTTYALIIGDENVIPMFELDTAGSSLTPSDLPYFALGYVGEKTADHIPDIFSGRIVATSSEVARAQLKKIMAQEILNASGGRQGSRSVIGVASNEGANPSDAEYVTGINATFTTALNGSSTYLYQDDENSIPATLNSSFDHGAYWMTYLGHGSGYSWPSMYDSYWTDNILKMQNQSSHKPVVIDVACQNGRLVEDHLGSKLMFSEQRPTDPSRGAIAYFGGTVNISWHPPAVMARGIAIEHASRNFAYIGEALMAGQFYLAANWQSVEDVVDNFEWYHLQGDPSFSIRY